MRPGSRRILPLLACLLLLAAAPARAQDPAPLPTEPPGRILHRFDFEERDDGNFEDLPMHWSKVTGPGLPHYVRGTLATDRAFEGRYSFRLDLNGASLIYRLIPDLLPAEPGAHYRVSGRVRTTQLDFARARITGYFVDDKGRMIPGSVRHSRLHATRQGERPGWVTLTIHLPPPGPEARAIVLELGLLQPAQLGSEARNLREGRTDPRVDLTRFRQDVRGSAWFDDVVVSRVPSVTLLSPEPGNVFPRSRPVWFTAAVDDSLLADLSAAAAVRDADGNEVARVAGRFLGEQAAGMQQVRFDLPPLPPGWYRATAVVTGGLNPNHVSASSGEWDTPIFHDPGNPPAPAATPEVATVREMSFVVLADEAPAAAPDSRITIDASPLAMEHWDELPSLLPALAAGRVKLSVWSRANNLDPAQADAFDALASSLDAQGTEITAVFAQPTFELAQVSGAGDWPALLPMLESAGEPTSESEAEGRLLFGSSLAYLAARHAQQVDAWQVGVDADAELFAGDERLASLPGVFDRALEDLIARPDVAMPWPVQLAAEPGPRLSLLIDSDINPRQIPLYVQEAMLRSGGSLSVSLEALSPERYGRLPALADLARRLTLCLASGVDEVSVPLPFEAISAPGAADHKVDVGDADASLQPTEAYFVLRTMMRHLHGAEYRGRIPAEPGVEAYLFVRPRAGGREGVLVVWDELARAGALGTSAIDLPLDLAGRATQVDLWGNTRPLGQDEAGRQEGRAAVPVGAMPTLIVGVDADLTRLRSTVRLDREAIESAFEPHEVRILLQNVFETPVSGTIELRPPEGWEAQFVEQGGERFTLLPGERLAAPVQLRFPYNSYAGVKTLEAHVTLRTGDREHRLRIPLLLKLGLEGVGLRTTAYRDGQDVIVEQTVTNYGDAPINYSAFVLVPDAPRQERLVAELAPGQTTTKTYRFPLAGRTDGAVTIRSGLRELQGTRILNDRVELAGATPG